VRVLGLGGGAGAGQGGREGGQSMTGGVRVINKENVTTHHDMPGQPQMAVNHPGRHYIPTAPPQLTFETTLQDNICSYQLPPPCQCIVAHNGWAWHTLQQP